MYKYPGCYALVRSAGAYDAVVMPRISSDAAVMVGKRIADCRRQRGMTQDQLDVASDIDSSNIRSYESGRAMMNVRSLVRIATALGIAPGELIDELTPDMFEAHSRRAA